MSESMRLCTCCRLCRLRRRGSVVSFHDELVEPGAVQSVAHLAELVRLAAVRADIKRIAEARRANVEARLTQPRQLGN